MDGHFPPFGDFILQCHFVASHPLLTSPCDPSFSSHVIRGRTVRQDSGLLRSRHSFVAFPDCLLGRFFFFFLNHFPTSFIPLLGN